MRILLRMGTHQAQMQKTEKGSKKREGEKRVGNQPRHHKRVYRGRKRTKEKMEGTKTALLEHIRSQ